MSNEFVIAEVMPGKLNALVKNIMRQTRQTDPNEAVRLINSGEWIISEPARRWRVDDNGWIRFSLTSTGETGAEWADWFRANDYDLGNETEFMLRSLSFQPSSVGTVYEIVVLPGKLWKDADRITSNIRTKSDELHLKHGKEMNPEVGCLIRRAFSNEEIEAMGFVCIIALHEPIFASDGCPHLFGASRYLGSRRFCAYAGQPGRRWSADGGFAVLVSQASSQVSES